MFGSGSQHASLHPLKSQMTNRSHLRPQENTGVYIMIYDRGKLTAMK